MRERIAAAITAKNEQLEQEEMNKKLSSQTIDVTLPGSQVNIGGRHPLTVVIEEIEDLFIGMGYTVEEGPEVETDYYNFEALNLPKEHPAREHAGQLLHYRRNADENADVTGADAHDGKA